MDNQPTIIRPTGQSTDNQNTDKTINRQGENMEEYCDIVLSQQGREKLVVKGYLMVKDKNRDDLIIVLLELHKLRSNNDHNHAPEASRALVAIANSILKDTAQSTTNKPSQIIQYTQSNISENIKPYLPSYEAQRKKIMRTRITHHHTEPNSIDDLNIPDNLKKILFDQILLIKESVIDKILVFSTVDNVKKLSQSMFWIVDGTFKTVPTIFTQLYTIHAQVGFCENSRVLPLVYVLMTSKREQCYNQMYQDIIDFSEDNNINLAPEYIISDFEIAAINASKHEFSLSKSKGCLFHLCQSAWRKLQSLGLSIEYGNNENFKIKEIMPNNASSFVQWFEDNYALGKVRRIVRIPNIGIFHFFLHLCDNGIPRTSNHAEAWHRRWNELVGRAHIGLFTLIKELQKEQSKRLKTAFDNREGKTRLEYLRGIAHNITM
ncbi:Uncharacterized protein FWK35_00007573 [Aphis craccivora]|uniref:MULE transposase domain-containing protein n=1 Tax=Aphis craccivora TaxID=307492 RepID=A0A6G0YT29_APHCR|nr:Uncharacterized protein FWK35_00007573 [Aphis craccivora]